VQEAVMGDILKLWLRGKDARQEFLEVSLKRLIERDGFD
jgi:hypothetical protein